MNGLKKLNEVLDEIVRSVINEAYPNGNREGWGMYSGLVNQKVNERFISGETKGPVTYSVYEKLDVLHMWPLDKKKILTEDDISLLGIKACN